MARRPKFSEAVQRLISHVASTVDAFRHIDAKNVLVVAGEARRASRATVKPMCFAKGKRVDALGQRKPLVRVGGERVLYVITLRPLFFRRSTPRQRVATLLHELFHISRKFDGTLERRLRHREGAEFDVRFRPIERRYWKQIPPEVLAPFAYDGELRVLQWLEKPQMWLPGVKQSVRTRYSEKQLFEGIVRMKTKQLAH